MNVHVPPAPTTVVPITVVPSKMDTVAPTSPVPSRLSGDDTALKAVIVGASGAVMSMVREAFDAPELSLPATSIANTSRTNTDCASGLAISSDHDPVTAVRVVPNEISPDRTVTNASASAVPVNTGVSEFFTMLLLLNAGLAGCTESITMTTEELNELSFPARSIVLVRIE